MMNKFVKTMIVTFSASLLSSAVLAETSNPFTTEQVANSRFEQVNYSKDDAKCGDAKCGGGMKKEAAEMKTSAKCGADMKKKAKCGAEMKTSAKCGADMKNEAKCGAEMKKSAKCGADMKKEAKCGGEMKGSDHH